MEQYIPTGNEMLSLPKIAENDASIRSLSFLSMQHKGLLELCGTEGKALFQPYCEGMDGASLHWERDHFWIPSATADNERFTYRLQILAPVRERGFIIHMEIDAKTDMPLSWGVKGLWSEVWHCINENKKLVGTPHCYQSGWNSGFIMDYRIGTPLFALAPMWDRDCKYDTEQAGDQVRYDIHRAEELKSGDKAELNIFWGMGYEEVAAATSAKEMLRRGYEWEYQKTAHWLDARSFHMKDAALTKLYNENLFFCIFYSTGTAYDTEELICATSRSSRYYVSAAYWDRDSLLWSFPAILDVDADLARRILEYVFTRQRRNIGVHSRYIDGTMLEPGFELDELVAPILALHAYVQKTGDAEILNCPETRLTIRQILCDLTEMKNEALGLYETFLQPTDDERVYPYLTYNNMLVWRAFSDLATLFPEKAAQYDALSAEVRKSIMQHCIFENANGPYFGWSVDGNGNHDIYDEPPGSLQLFPYYGFVDSTSEVWQNTVQMIRSQDYAYSFAGHSFAEIGCPHAPHPWILSLCNSLLCGYADQAWDELKRIRMDNGIACESVDENTGECATGAAFATCAGFLCHSMRTAYLEEV